MRNTLLSVDRFGDFILSSQVYTNARDLARFGLGGVSGQTETFGPQLHLLYTGDTQGDGVGKDDVLAEVRKDLDTRLIHLRAGGINNQVITQALNNVNQYIMEAEAHPATFMTNSINRLSLDTTRKIHTAWTSGSGNIDYKTNVLMKALFDGDHQALKKKEEDVAATIGIVKSAVKYAFAHQYMNEAGAHEMETFKKHLLDRIESANRDVGAAQAAQAQADAP